MEEMSNKTYKLNELSNIAVEKAIEEVRSLNSFYWHEPVENTIGGLGQSLGFVENPLQIGDFNIPLGIIEISGKASLADIAKNFLILKKKESVKGNPFFQGFPQSFPFDKSEMEGIFVCFFQNGETFNDGNLTKWSSASAEVSENFNGSEKNKEILIKVAAKISEWIIMVSAFLLKNQWEIINSREELVKRALRENINFTENGGMIL